MSYRIRLERRVVRRLRGLPAKVQARLKRRVDELKETPRPPSARQVRGTKQPLFRIRSGDYRIVYRVDDGAREVWIVLLGDRADVYEELPRLPR